ncbi:hypothetical protein [Herbaspirillum sp.]|uniref:hypothetical protein n=1 Tax=Herbaspirillum sp. TaxID=1890675 RepID=UPI001B0BA842|nr:hypothetical protein [Herbaspirillum sp.]MBO9537855.1 hypothetical protein [Herbaspirillum sp.]
MYSQIEALRQQLVQAQQFAAVPGPTSLSPSMSPLSTQLIQPIQSNAPQPGTERSATELQQELAQQQLELEQLLKQDPGKTKQELLQKLLEQTKQQQQALTQKQQEETKQQLQTQQQRELEKTKLIEQEIAKKKQELMQQLLEKTKKEQQEQAKEQPEQAKQQQPESVQKQAETTKQEQQEPIQEQSNPGTLATYFGAGRGDQQAQAQLTGMSDPGASIAAGTIAITDIATNTPPLITAVMASMPASTSSSTGGNTGNPTASVQDALQQTLAAATVQSQQLSYGYVTAGLVTPIASWPTSLVATYTGNVGGTLNNGAAVSGVFQATVDFSTIRNMTPSIPGSITFAGGQGSTSFTLSQLGGYIGGSMSGTYGGQAVTGYVMNGVFYGPAAEQMAGQWSMQNAGATLTGNGNFQAQR